jgi:hypothetical protein
MSAHTPGPWTIKGPIRDGQDISIEARRASGNPQYIGRVYSAGILAKSDPEAEANARLIAAAPALLQVAEGALGYLEALPVAARPDEAWFAPLRAAIRAAKGERQ